jgi:HAD superfamily hydrolase (TIGR01509 family)
MAFDLVIFDCDGVLIDSEAISARMLISELAARGVVIDLPYVAHHFLGRSYAVVLSQIRTEFGVDLPPEFETGYRERLLACFETDLVALPGVGRIIADIGCDYCLATSSSPPRVKRSLEIVGLDRAFEGRVTTAAEVTHGKPEPDLFLLAARKRGVSPDRCLVIEDSLNGVQAGLAAGMTVWRFTGGSHLGGTDEPAGAAEVFASFKDMPQFAPDLFNPKDVNDAAP